MRSDTPSAGGLANLLKTPCGVHTAAPVILAWLYFVWSVVYVWRVLADGLCAVRVLAELGKFLALCLVPWKAIISISKYLYTPFRNRSQMYAKA